MTSTTPHRGDSGKKRERSRAIGLVPEVRYLRSAPDRLEIRADKKGQATIEGLNPTGRAYTVVDHLGEYEETLAPGCFRALLAATPDVLLLTGHDQGMVPLARTKSGTLRLQEDADGLRFTASLDMRSQSANDCVIALERGDLDSVSIGFSCGKDTWDAAGERRTIHEIRRLFELSIVSFPANQFATVALQQERMLARLPAEQRGRLRHLAATAQPGAQMTAAHVDALRLLASGEGGYRSLSPRPAGARKARSASSQGEGAARKRLVMRAAARGIANPQALSDAELLKRLRKRSDMPERLAASR